MSKKIFKLRLNTTGAEVEVTADLLVGRHVACGLRLTQTGCSEKHALFSIYDDSLWLCDLASTHGTFLNDRRMEGRMELHSEDRVRFGPEEITVGISSAALDGASETKPRWLKLRGGTDKTELISTEQRAALRRLESKREARGAASEDGFAILEFSPAEPALPAIRLRVIDSRPLQEWMVGSDSDCDIQLQREGVSALHATITRTGRHWKITDKLSANGTFVNGTRVARLFLSTGDEIQIGPVSSIIRLPADTMEPAEGGFRRRLKRWWAAFPGIR
jgi:pSer/pThr/pTyr-binding forkhead associated (FHA) protein